MGKGLDNKEEKLYDTFSITMELERPILCDELENEDIDEKEYSKPKKSKNIFKLSIAAIIIVFIGLFIWLNDTYNPSTLAKQSLISDSNVAVNNESFISFTPVNKEVTKGMIFYPGAKVEAESYAPIARNIAEHGYEVIIVKPTFNLAILSPNKAKEVINKYPNIKTWIVGGHSLGGTIAAKFASDNKAIINGVVLLSSYPMNDDLKNLNMNVVSIWGSKDGVVDFKSLVEAKDKLPADTNFVEIEGGNHSQFGDYGLQKGDNEAIISEKEQLNITTNNIIKFLNNIK